MSRDSGNPFVPCFGCSDGPPEDSSMYYSPDGKTPGCLRAFQASSDQQSAPESFPGDVAYAEYLRMQLVDAFADSCRAPSALRDLLLQSVSHRFHEAISTEYSVLAAIQTAVVSKCTGTWETDKFVLPQIISEFCTSQDGNPAIDRTPEHTYNVYNKQYPGSMPPSDNPYREA